MLHRCVTLCVMCLDAATCLPTSIWDQARDLLPLRSSGADDGLGGSIDLSVLSGVGPGGKECVTGFARCFAICVLSF